MSLKSLKKIRDYVNNHPDCVYTGDVVLDLLDIIEYAMVTEFIKEEKVDKLFSSKHYKEDEDNDAGC